MQKVSFNNSASYSYVKSKINEAPIQKKQEAESSISNKKKVAIATIGGLATVGLSVAYLVKTNKLQGLLESIKQTPIAGTFNKTKNKIGEYAGDKFRCAKKSIEQITNCAKEKLQTLLKGKKVYFGSHQG